MMITIFIITDLILIISFAFLPYITRKTELFGVSIPSGETNNTLLVGMKRSYRNISLLVGLLMIVSHVVCAMAGLTENQLVVVFIVLITLYLLVMFVIYLKYHTKMKAFKAQQTWRNAGKEDGDAILIVDTDPIKNEVISPLWLLLYPVLAIATALIIREIWPIVPDKIPVNIDFAGNVATWTDKSIGSVVAMLAVQWTMFIVFAIVYFIIRNSKRQIDASNPDVSKEQGRRFRFIMSASMIFGGAIIGIIIGGLFIILMLGVPEIWMMYLSIALLLITVAFMVVIYLRVGQGGSRLKTHESNTASVQNRDDDKHWLLGIFYFNRNDPSLFVEKRFGVGYTNNFARPMSWVILCSVFAVVGLLIWVTYALIG